MIFNEKAFIRLLKRTFKTGLIYGYIDERYIFGGDNWRAAIDEDYVTPLIIGELMKLTGLYPKEGSVFTINKEKMAQYTFTDPREFSKPDDGVRVGVTDITLSEYMRVTRLVREEKLGVLFEDFIQLLDRSNVRDDEDIIEGPFYSITQENYYWFNDTCILKVTDEYKEVYNETLEMLRKYSTVFPVNAKYTFHTT